MQLVRAPEQIKKDDEIGEMLKEGRDDVSLKIVEPAEPIEIKTVISPDFEQTFPDDENVLHVTSHALLMPQLVTSIPLTFSTDNMYIFFQVLRCEKKITFGKVENLIFRFLNLHIFFSQKTASLSCFSSYFD